MNEVIQVDGKPFTGMGAVECRRVVVIPGKLVNIVTKPTDPNNWVRITDDDGNKTVEGSGPLFESMKQALA